MSDLTEALKRIEALETQCHFFHMQVEKMVHLYSMVQVHELQLFKIENPDGFIKEADRNERKDSPDS